MIFWTTAIQTSDTERQSVSQQAEKKMTSLVYQVTKHKKWWFGKNAQGMPYAIDLLSGTPIYISISHSKNVIACAFSQIEPVGIDIEFHKDILPDAIISAYFSTNERLYCESHGLDAFYKVWTLREASAKALGQGITMAIDSRCTLSHPDKTDEWIEDNRLLYSCHPMPNYSLAISAYISNCRITNSPNKLCQQIVLVPTKEASANYTRNT